MTVRPTPPAVDPAIVGDIKRASRAANVDFGYMMAQAAQESSFQPDAKASTSSATGLFQFIDSTWLNSVKQYGGKYGLGHYADQITTDASGHAHVADPAVKQQILDLRKDPKVSSDIAAEFAKANKDQVEKALGHQASPTDLYLAHFLGAQGATEMVKTVQSASSTKAADLLPQAAAANHSVFYDGNGDAKTVAQIYKSFADKIEKQISQYSESTGTDPEVAAESLAVKDEAAALPSAGDQSLGTMNVLALAALKLLSGNTDGSTPAPAAQGSRRRPTDTSA
jgi:Transglycosylase SLT domain